MMRDEKNRDVGMWMVIDDNVMTDNYDALAQTQTSVVPWK